MQITRKDWLLIRAILLQEDLSNWSSNEISAQLLLCLDAKYLSIIKRYADKPLLFSQYIRVTALGSEIAERLANYDDVDDVLTELEAQDLGAPSELFFAMVREKALARLGRQEESSPKRRGSRKKSR